jgi:hypothetical protein
MLEKQLVLKQIMTIEDFDNIAADLKYDFTKDNFFTELKNAEMLENRINLAHNFQDMVGKYYSNEWLRKNILQQSDDDIKEMDEQINEERDSGDSRWIDPNQINNEMMQQQLETNPMNQDMGQSDDAQNQNPANAADAKAQSTYDMLSQKKNRTLSDEAKLKSASQSLSKNK